jgi:hypothetical protein
MGHWEIFTQYWLFVGLAICTQKRILAWNGFNTRGMVGTLAQVAIGVESVPWPMA